MFNWGFGVDHVWKYNLLNRLFWLLRPRSSEVPVLPVEPAFLLLERLDFAQEL